MDNFYTNKGPRTQSTANACMHHDFILDPGKHFRKNKGYLHIHPNTTKKRILYRAITSTLKSCYYTRIVVVLSQYRYAAQLIHLSQSINTFRSTATRIPRISIIIIIIILQC